MTLLLAAGNGKLLWYVTRGSGVVALLLLTAAVLLGILSALRWRSERWPRFATTNAHRNLTLVSIVFVAIHVVTTVADGYAPITLLDGVFPFLSPYRTLWLGLGTVAFDLLLALVVTSLMRGRIPARLWRGLHWLAYVSWPVALMHSLGTGSDARTAWLQALGIASLAAVALAVLARIGLGGGLRNARVAGALAALAVPVAILAWYQSGPLQRGWARRSGTPSAILARKAIALGRAPTQQVAAKVTTPSEPSTFTSTVHGTVTTSQGGDGMANVDITVRLARGPKGAARIDLQGIPSGEGVSMTASGVSFVPATTGSVYTGKIVSLSGTDVGAVVRDAAGHRLDLHFALSIDPNAGVVSGTVRSL